MSSHGAKPRETQTADGLARSLAAGCGFALWLGYATACGTADGPPPAKSTTLDPSQGISDAGPEGLVLSDGSSEPAADAGETPGPEPMADDAGPPTRPLADGGADAQSLHVATLDVATFNIQSIDADLATITWQLEQTRSADLWGFVEVDDDWVQALVDALEKGAERKYGYILGTSSQRRFRLLIAYDQARFSVQRTEELFDVGTSMGRAPLLAELRDRELGLDLLFMVNHLQREDQPLRHRQASALRTWAANQTLPVVAVGDYNFDWELLNGDDRHDRGYDLLTQDGTFVWVRPAALFPTQCSSFRSVLDFIFAANDARTWDATAKILDTDRPCADNDLRSDHRPVWAQFQGLSAAAHGDVSTQGMLAPDSQAP